MARSFSDKLAHVTGGRRYCFVIMTYHGSYAFFERIRAIVAEATGLECIRADDIPGAGEDLREKIHSAVDNAAFVIADVSEPRPNIYYEVGYAIARDKAVLLLAQQDVTIPTDLLGVELIRYVDSKEGWPKFEQTLRKHLAVHGESHLSLLRAMIIPRDPHPSYILANPKTPNASSRFQFHPRERRTYGDHLGVVGILGAFGQAYGEHVVPELLSAAFAPDDLTTWDANFYLIGSPKVNRATDLFLETIQSRYATKWSLQPTPGETQEGDYEVQLSGTIDTVPFRSPSHRSKLTKDTPYEDFGLVVRGPNPRHPKRMVTILAGPHSLGTAAACLAATNSRLIREIARKLTGAADLAAQDRTIWVLVKGISSPDLHIGPDEVTILHAGVYE